jgi:hypothetical protein
MKVSIGAETSIEPMQPMTSVNQIKTTSLELPSAIINMEDVQQQLTKSLESGIKKINNDLNTQLRTSIDKATGNIIENLIQADNVKNISYLLASDQGLGRSSFGHAYIRISYQDKLSIKDDTIEFVADVSNKDIEYTRALGLGKKYGVKIVKRSYAKTKKIHTIGDDRSLSSYTLDLSPDQIKIIISKINLHILSGYKTGYSFFTSNCGDIVGTILNSALEEKITGMTSVVPNRIPTILEDLNLVKSVHTDDNASALREKLVQKNLGKLVIPKSSINLHSVKDNLSSQLFADRVKGYYQLQVLMGQLTNIEALRISIFVRKMTTYEDSTVKSELIKLFSKRKPKVYEFARIEYELSGKKYKIGKNLSKIKFSVKNDIVQIRIKLKNRTSKRTEELRFDVTSLSYEEGKIIDRRGNIVAYKVDTELVDSGFYSPSTFLGAEVVKNNGKLFLSSILVTETQIARKKLKPREFNEFDRLASD